MSLSARYIFFIDVFGDKLSIVRNSTCKNITFILDLEETSFFSSFHIWQILRKRHMCVLQRVYRHPRMRHMLSCKVIALSYALFSVRDSVSDLIAYGEFSGRATFDRGMTGRSSVKQTQIRIFLRREGRGMIKGRTEILWPGRTERFKKKEERGGRKREWSDVSLRHLDRGLATTHTYFTHMRGWEGGRVGEREKEGLM